MLTRLTLVSFLLCACACVARADEAPTPQQIQDWWKASSTEELNIDGPLMEVVLMDKEVAFIAPVSLYPRGRNFIWHAALIRPKLHQVRELPYPVGYQNITILHFDDDDASVVMSDDVASGQGSTDRTRSVVRLDGFSPVVMHIVVDGDDLGSCGPGLNSPNCKEVRTEWKFGPSEMTETVTTRTGHHVNHLAAHKEVRRYVLRGNYFVRDDAR